MVHLHFPQLVVWNIKFMFFHSVFLGKSWRVDFHIFQWGRLNHQPVTVLFGLRLRKMLSFLVEFQIRFASMVLFLLCFFASKIYDYSLVFSVLLRLVNILVGGLEHFYFSIYRESYPN